MILVRKFESQRVSVDSVGTCNQKYAKDGWQIEDKAEERNVGKSCCNCAPYIEETTPVTFY